MDNKGILKTIHGTLFGLGVFFITQFLIHYFPPATYFYNNLEKKAYDVQVNLLRQSKEGEWLKDREEQVGTFSVPLNYKTSVGWNVQDIKKSVYFVTYDDVSYETLNIKNISRTMVAEAIDLINLGEPKVIGLDLIYTSDNPEEDPILIESLRKAGNVVLGAMVQSKKVTVEEIENLIMQLDGEKGLYEIRNVNGEMKKYKRELFSLTQLISKDEPVETVRGIKEAARGVGFIDIRKDEDGVIRRIPYWVYSGYLDKNFPKWGCQKALPTFSGMLFAAYLGREKDYLNQLDNTRDNFNLFLAGNGNVVNDYTYPQKDLTVIMGNEYSHLPGRSFLLDFLRPLTTIGKNRTTTEKAGYFPEFFPSMKLESLLSIYKERLSVAEFELEDEEGITPEKIKKRAYELVKEDFKRAFKDRIIILGTTAKSDQDAYSIPIIGAGIIPGMEIHALGISSLLGGKLLQAIPVGSVYWFNLFLCMGTSILFSLLKISISIALLFGLSFTLIFLGTYVLMGKYFFVVPIATPLLYMFINFFYHSLQKYYVQWSEKARIKNMFYKFVSPTVIEDMILHPDKFKLGGEKKTMTVFFSDIRSFTTYSEKHQPEYIVKVLNEYLTAMCADIKNLNGTIDKLVGDEIMALFGAPINYENHAEMAIRACIQQVKTIEKMWANWESLGIDYVDFGMGINTGEVICGFMGAEDFYNYTVIGDTVNLAARVEGLTRDYDCYLIMTEFTYEHVKDIAVVNELDSVKVKGKNKPVVIFEVLGVKDDPYRFPKPRVSKKHS